jgi:CRISPR-associated exonuclease Cas4
LIKWPHLFALFLAAGLLLLWLAHRMRTSSGLPRGRVVYTDTTAWRPVSEAFFSEEHQLTGRPDYLVADGDDLIPVEVKSGPAPVRAYRSHVLQLAAYCLLVETCTGQNAPYGIIKYADRAVEIDYTAALRKTLLATMATMRDDIAAGDAARNHDDVHRCEACGHRDRCDERLVG